MVDEEGEARSRMVFVLPLLSGVSALLFETLWFRQVGLVLGNTVWTSSLVLASFMAGLALGNGLAARVGGRALRPLRAYAGLEAAIGVTGLVVATGLPSLAGAMASLPASLLHSPAALNGLRFACGFVLLSIPATAMGATLPLLVRYLTRTRGFGPSLGWLYGWNTLGAVLGALAGEMVLIEALGVRATAVVAFLLNLGAATGALALQAGVAPPPRDVEAGGAARVPRNLLGAAALAGFLLLALEVVWFRLLLLFVNGTSLAFAVLLAVVLVGIALGGFAGSLVLRRWPRAGRGAPLAALFCSIVVVVGYAALQGAVSPAIVYRPAVMAALAVRLMLATCVGSGLLFTLVGAALGEEVSEPSRATGLLTLANTLGAMAGSLAAGFILLPRLGMEASVFLLAALYLAVAALCAGRRPGLAESRLRPALLAAGLAAALALALFPFGLMRTRYLRLAAERWQFPGWRPIAAREGLTETILYLRQDILGTPVRYRLVTNAISMSATGAQGGRYMKLFAYWPACLHPRARRALLVSYGVGQTAQALVNLRQLSSIDVVDISRDVLEMGRLAYPGASYPLDDPRVRVHVEDGRFHLLTTDLSYDIITAEPPPPKFAGIINLYSREYFATLRRRLAPGGIATYWLPTYQLQPAEARSIMKAFCLAFPDCSLWEGYGPEWVLAGTAGAASAPTEAEFTRLWSDPATRADLREIGFERPEQMGTTFVADAAEIAAFTASDLPLEDDHPYRVSPREASGTTAYFDDLGRRATAASRFASSAFVRAHWPATLLSRTVAQFPAERPLKDVTWASYGHGKVGVAQLGAALRSGLEIPVLWAMDSGRAEVEAARRNVSGGGGAFRAYHLGAEALARHDYPAAETLLAEAQRGSGTPERVAQYRVLAALMAQRPEEAERIRAASRPLRTPAGEPGWRWLAEAFPGGSVAAP